MPNDPWLHESLGDSIRTIVLGFLVSSVFGVPLGILCGTYRFFAKLQEPFIEFFRYLPAPAFGALCVAVLGIDDPPKIAIIFIGTFFQQVLVIANSVRKVDPGLLEAAQTLGASGWKMVSRVIIPSSITDIYTDMRILLGWAAVAGLCAVATVGGYQLQETAGASLQGGIDGFAAGALLVMLVGSMIPEANEKAREQAGLAAVLGFALAAGLSLAQ